MQTRRSILASALIAVCLAFMPSMSFAEASPRVMAEGARVILVAYDLEDKALQSAVVQAAVEYDRALDERLCTRTPAAFAVSVRQRSAAGHVSSIRHDNPLSARGAGIGIVHRLS